MAMLMAMSSNAQSPARTIRPGDLLTGDGVPNLIDTAQKMNAVGELVGACNTSAPVYIGWDVRYFRDVIGQSRQQRPHCAVVFGPREAVRDRFIDIHRTFGQGQFIRNVRSRTMELQNESRIVFLYLDEAQSCRGMHFHSVWIVGENYNRIYYDSEGHQFSSLEDRDSSEIRIQNAVTSVAQVRARSRYGRGIVEEQIDAINVQQARMDLLRERFRDGADRSMVQRETNPAQIQERSQIPERERELRRELDFLTQQLQERTQTSITTTSTSPVLGPGVGSNAQMRVPLDVNGVDRRAWAYPFGDVTVESEKEKPEEPSEPIRFPEKRTFLKEDDE